MNSEKPTLISIDHDDYHAEHIGITQTGNQFFLTSPFVPATNGEVGCEYIAVFLFDKDGNFLEADIETLGPRKDLTEPHAAERYKNKLENLGSVSFEDIEVKLFSVEFNGVQFSLIAREPEGEEGVWAVELVPGNYMAFFEPWDSGTYDT